MAADAAGTPAHAPALLLGLVLGDLLRAAAAEQPRPGEALHDLPHVLHGVDQVVDVGADGPEGLQDRQDVLVQVRDQLRQPVDEGDQRLDLGRVEGRREPADRRREGGERRLVVAQHRLHPTDHALGPAHRRVGAGGRPLDRGDGVVRLLAGPRDRLDGLVGLGLVRADARRWPRRPWPACGRRPRWPSSALAWVRATPSMASSAAAAGRRRRRSIASSARSTMPSTRSSSADTRASSSSIRPTAAPTRGTRASASAMPSRTPLHGGEDVGRSRHRGQSHPPHATHRDAWRHYSVAPVVAPVRGTAARASGVVDRRRPRIVGDRGTDGARTTTRRCRHRWGNSRRGTARVAMGIPMVAPAASPGAPAGPATASRAPRPVTVEQLLARQGSAVGSRRRAARRVEEPREQRPQARITVEPAPAVRIGSAARPGSRQRRGVRQAGLPPVPGAAARPASAAGLPPVPVPARPAAWEPDSRPSRRSGPIPPLPGTVRRRDRSTQDPEAPARRRPGPRAAPAGAGVVRALMALGAVVGVVLLYHLGLYFYVDQKIDRVDALAIDGPEVLAPALQAGAETYLVVGSGVPGQTGAASVATLLASVSPRTASAPCSSASRRPRSSTPRPAAPLTGRCGTRPRRRSPRRCSRAARPAWCGRSSSSRGCASTTTWASTSPGLPGMVDALGGVPVCVAPVGGERRGGEPAASRGSPRSRASTAGGLPGSRAPAGPTSPGPRSPSGPSGCSRRPCARPCPRARSPTRSR